MKTPGNKSYSIVYAETVVNEDIPSLPKSVTDLIKKAIVEQLLIDPQLWKTFKI